MRKIKALILLFLIVNAFNAELHEGMTHSKTIKVTQDKTADALGNTGVNVFATPYLVALVEVTSRELMAPFLEKGTRSVGTEVNLNHLGATPVGMEVTCNVKLTKIDGRRYVFEAQVYDEADLIGTAQHERFIIKEEKFINKAKAKLEKVKGKKDKIINLMKETEVFLLDMDGTIYFDETPIGDMVNTLKKLREAGKKLVYFTNNSSKSPDEYVKKLKKIGFWDDRDLVYTSGMATAEYINDSHKGKKVYLVGTDALKKNFLEDYKINLVEEDPDIAVLAYDTTLTFEKLKKINKYIVNGALYIATHPDNVCPSKDVFPPDVGSFIALLEVSSGKKPDLICGKPFTVMGDCISRKLNVPKNKICMVGDRLHTDIRFGVNNGFHTILVLSGETTKEIMKTSPDKPECVLDSLNDAIKYL